EVGRRPVQIGRLRDELDPQRIHRPHRGEMPGARYAPCPDVARDDVELCARAAGTGCERDVPRNTALEALADEGLQVCQLPEAQVQASPSRGWIAACGQVAGDGQALPGEVRNDDMEGVG